MVKKLLLTTAVAMIAAVAWSQDGWLQQVEDLMNQGEFKKAEALMKSLPKNATARSST